VSELQTRGSCRVNYLRKGSRRAGFWNADCFLSYADTATNALSREEEELFSSSFANGASGVASYYPDFYNVQSLVDLVQSLAQHSVSHRERTSGQIMVATARATAQASCTVCALVQCTGDVTAADCA
jgi:uncharacterized protein HemX